MLVKGRNKKIPCFTLTMIDRSIDLHWLCLIWLVLHARHTAKEVVSPNQELTHDRTTKTPRELASYSIPSTIIFILGIKEISKLLARHFRLLIDFICCCT
jgi:hypothetical protein